MGASKMSVTDDLKYKFSEAILDTFMQSDGKPGVVIRKEALRKVCAFLKEAGFEHLSLISGVDMPSENRVLVVYHFWSYTNKQDYVLNVWLDREQPVISSICDLWRSADWMERETYDLVGVTFEGHPNLKRILLPEGWTGHPLRKDYDMDTEQFVIIGEDGEDIITTDASKLYREEVLHGED
jgi:NADH-quinone oxidoreductase subunit C